MQLQSIERATSYDTAVVVVPKEETKLGVQYLQKVSRTIPRRVIVPIDRGGGRVGEDLAHAHPNIHLVTNNMQMSHRGENGEYLAIPRLVKEPDVMQIIDTHTRSTKAVIFAEAVVESQATILGATDVIEDQIREFNRAHESHFPMPVFYTLTLIDKINDLVRISNYIPAFTMPKPIWVAGYKCDDGEQGRELDHFVGRLADNYTGPIPQGPPYYIKNF